MKILAVDYGASRTGLAVCDPTEFLTTPITPQITLKARPKVAAEVCRIAQEQKAELIVVGLPLNMDGTEGERAEKSRKLGKTLQIWSGLPVRMWDERQSTCEAADILDEVGTFGAHRKAILDSVSATVILEVTSPGARSTPAKFEPEAKRDAFQRLFFVYMGNVTVKQLPCPGALFTWILPPWSSSTFFTMARPRPLPWVVWLVSP